MGLTREFSRRFSGQLNLNYKREDFDRDDGLIAHTLHPVVGLDYRQTRDLTWEFGVGLEKRYEDGGIGQSFEEHYVSAGLVWNLR